MQNKLKPIMRLINIKLKSKGFEDSEAKVKQYYRAIERGWGEWKEATDWERKAMMELLKETYPEYFTVVKDGYSEIIDTQSKFNELVQRNKSVVERIDRSVSNNCRCY